MARRNALRIGCTVAGIALLGLGFWLYPLLRIAQGYGVMDQEAQGKYNSDTMANLKNIYLALEMYKESEGQYPVAAGWMDAAFLRLKTGDLSEDEAKKKLRSPSAKGPDEFGYAFNDEVSGKADPDFPDPKQVVLVFDSNLMGWNAHGKATVDEAKPQRPGGNKAVLLSGEIVKLDDWLKARH